MYSVEQLLNALQNDYLDVDAVREYSFEAGEHSISILCPDKPSLPRDLSAISSTNVLQSETSSTLSSDETKLKRYTLCLMFFAPVASDDDAEGIRIDILHLQGDSTNETSSNADAASHKSCRLFGLLKLETGDLVPVKELYASSGHCVVCFVRDVSIVLLPCRHICLCPVCLQLVDECPICRSHIQSYFSNND